ncbi:DUF2637 domain-containing protein [Kutzneria buriramensis]|uniref:DUF2637 domain-containing protein n=1 Tax=Kutzneria buriramensis TaxID=1045776 RepID=A0A3E0G3Q8_9PSEU|nr:DUF2637 domain-containing protein [Kutzneria buriramensis]REH17432.1 hypothetical protein BCF44_1474 [Kutzneria buriramensis]
MNSKAESAVRWSITAGLGLIGAAAGFTHTHDWAVQSGQDGWLAWADAVVIECMALVAGLELHRNPRRPAFPITVMVISFLVQMAGQVALAQPSVPGWLLAATPALGFLVTAKLAMRGLAANDQQPPAPVEQAVATRMVRVDPAPEPVREIAPAETPVDIPEQPVKVSAAPSWPPQ